MVYTNEKWEENSASYAWGFVPFPVTYISICFYELVPSISDVSAQNSRTYVMTLGIEVGKEKPPEMEIIDPKTQEVTRKCFKWVLKQDNASYPKRV